MTTKQMALEASKCPKCGHHAAHDAEGACPACFTENGPCKGPAARREAEQYLSVEQALRVGLEQVVQSDVESLVRASRHYGTSWRNRGGVGAFMMLARKWDRLENKVKTLGYDIFEAVEVDRRAEGIMDDIRDLRRYLALVEEHLIAKGVVVPEVPKD